jgi:hypothetical protein
VAVAVEPVVELEEIVPEPNPGTIVQVPLVALPPIVPLRGIVRGSHTAKSVPAFAVATGLTVAVTIVVAPSHEFAVGVIVYVTVPTNSLVVVKT